MMTDVLVLMSDFISNNAPLGSEKQLLRPWRAWKAGRDTWFFSRSVLTLTMVVVVVVVVK